MVDLGGRDSTRENCEMQITFGANNIIDKYFMPIGKLHARTQRCFGAQVLCFQFSKSARSSRRFIKNYIDALAPARQRAIRLHANHRSLKALPHYPVAST
jgi:hypothetical protein